MQTYICPVCGYSELDEPPERYNICVCCGTEFENDDYDKSHAELRAEWVASGAKWWSEHTPMPVDWDAKTQLAKFDSENS